MRYRDALKESPFPEIEKTSISASQRRDQHFEKSNPFARGRFLISLFRYGCQNRAAVVTSLGLVTLVLLISTILCRPCESMADDASQSSAISGRPLKTVIVPDYYPYTFVNDRGIPDGFSVDLSRAVAQSMDMKLEISVDTWKHAKAALENGSIDFILQMTSSPLRRQSFVFSVPYVILYDSVFVRKGTQRIRSLDDLSEKTIIVMNKDAAHDYLLTTPMAASIRLILVDSLPDALRLLSSGKGDAAIMPKLVGLLLAKKLGIENVGESPLTIDSYKRPFSFAARKADTSLIEALNQGLSLVKDNGKYRSIYEKWFGVLAPPGLPWRSVITYIAAILAGSGLIGMGLLAWSLSLKRLVAQRTKTLESEISVRKRTEASLRESEERFRLAMEAVNDGVWDCDVPSGKVFRSSSFFSMLGFEREKFPDNEGDWHHLIDPDHLQTVQQLLPEYFLGQRDSHEIEFRVKTKRGDIAWIMSRGKVVSFGADGKPLRIVGTHTDITERKLVEEAMALREQEFRTLVEHTTDFIVRYDMDLRRIYVNPAWEKASGLSAEEVINVGIADIPKVAYPANAEYLEKLRQVLESGTPQKIEFTWENARGEALFLDYSIVPEYDLHGKIVSVLSVGHDLTDRRHAEEALSQSERMLKTILSTSPIGMSLTKKRRIEWINDAWRQMFGFDDERDCLGQDVRMLYGSQDEYDRVGNEVYGNIEDGGTGETETRFIRTDGSIFDAHMRTKALDPADPDKGVISAISDISSRKRAEEVRRRLATAIEHAAEAIIITDALGVIQYVNPATEQITGFKKPEMLGNNPRIFSSGEHDKAFYDKLWNTIRAGEVWSGRITNKTKDGTRYHVDTSISPVRDAFGSIVNFVAVNRDVTEHLKLTQQLFQAQKMEAVGTLAGGIAHDFNNLLQVILGYSELLLVEDLLSDTARNDLEKVVLAARNGTDLIQRLLTFSRKTEPTLLNLDLNQRIRQTRKFLERTIPKMIDIEMILAENLAAIHADPSQLDQIVMNLAVNARDAMLTGGRLTIKTENVVLDEEYVRTHAGAKPGDYVLLSMSDTGHGIDKKTLEHIFEPFYTTKEVGVGTGLGLAMVYGIVEQHGGSITCYSEPGLGATFKIYIPAVIPEAQDEQPINATMPQGGTETILLVDDEELLRSLGKRILERSGYTVFTAPNGEEALSLYNKEKDKISLVILDLIMPEMGGKQCLEEMLKINRQVKAIIASGFTVNGDTKTLLAAKAKGIVPKPFNVKELLLSVREVLDGP